MAKAPPLAAVVFDAYGTLLDIHAAVGRHAARLGAKADAVSALWRAKQLEYSWILSQAGSYEDFWQLTDRALSHALAVHGVKDEELRAELLDAYRRLDAWPDAASTLKQLRTNGLATAILSNGSPEMLESAVSAAGLSPALDAVLSVHPLRRYKPHPSVYALATSFFDCQPHDIAFVSANAWDAYGAARFGFRVHWLNRSGQPSEYWLEQLAASRIAALSELPGRLSA